MSEESARALETARVRTAAVSQLRRVCRVFDDISVPLRSFRDTDSLLIPALTMGPGWRWHAPRYHARVLSSMECRVTQAGRGCLANRVTPLFSMLTLRVSMAPGTVPGASGSRSGVGAGVPIVTEKET